MEAAVNFARQIGARRVTIVSNNSAGACPPAYRKARLRRGPRWSPTSVTSGPTLRLERELGSRSPSCAAEKADDDQQDYGPMNATNIAPASPENGVPHPSGRKATLR